MRIMRDQVRVSSSIPDVPTTIPTIRPDPWLVDTLEQIALHRGLPNNWDGQQSLAPDESLFEAAEILASEFARMCVHWRPTFAIDPEGKPAFAAYNDDIYLSLTVDSPDHVSWYSVIGGREEFRDEVPVVSLEMGSLGSENSDEFVNVPTSFFGCSYEGNPKGGGSKRPRCSTLHL